VQDAIRKQFRRSLSELVAKIEYHHSLRSLFACVPGFELAR
jgi:hypothetical protein